MNARATALRAGAQRGLIEFRRSLTHLPDMGFYVAMAVVLLGSTWFQRDAPVPGSDLPLPVVVLPGVIGGLIVFGAIISVAYTIAAEREDGTVLRAKALPYGTLGYLTGQTLRASLETVFAITIVMVPAFFLFEGFDVPGVGGWLTFAWVLVLGLAATFPFGAILGSVVKGAQKVGTWGMSGLLVMAMISGIFVPVVVWADWVQTLAQVFPLYWLGLGMRSVFLPDAAAAFELAGSWQPLMTAGVLAAWAIAGNLIAPSVLRRMARRESGSAVEARRERTLARPA